MDSFPIMTYQFLIPFHSGDGERVDDNPPRRFTANIWRGKPEMWNDSERFRKPLWVDSDSDSDEDTSADEGDEEDRAVVAGSGADSEPDVWSSPQNDYTFSASETGKSSTEQHISDIEQAHVTTKDTANEQSPPPITVEATIDKALAPSSEPIIEQAQSATEQTRASTNEATTSGEVTGPSNATASTVSTTETETATRPVQKAYLHFQYRNYEALFRCTLPTAPDEAIEVELRRVDAEWHPGPELLTLYTKGSEDDDVVVRAENGDPFLVLDLVFQYDDGWTNPGYSIRAYGKRWQGSYMPGLDPEDLTKIMAMHEGAELVEPGDYADDGEEDSEDEESEVEQEVHEGRDDEENKEHPVDEEEIGLTPKED